MVYPLKAIIHFVHLSRTFVIHKKKSNDFVIATRQPRRGDRLQAGGEVQRSKRNPCKQGTNKMNPEGVTEVIIDVSVTPSGLIISPSHSRGSATLHHLPVFLRPFGAYTSTISIHIGTTAILLP